MITNGKKKTEFCRAGNPVIYFRVNARTGKKENQNELGLNFRLLFGVVKRPGKLLTMKSRLSGLESLRVYLFKPNQTCC